MQHVALPNQGSSSGHLHWERGPPGSPKGLLLNEWSLQRLSRHSAWYICSKQDYEWNPKSDSFSHQESSQEWRAMYVKPEWRRHEGRLDSSFYLKLQAVALQKTLESPLAWKEIKPVNPKGNQPWIFIGKTDAETEAPILWPPDSKSWLTGKDPNARKDWGQEKRATEDEMVGWHHWLNGHEFG